MNGGPFPNAQPKLGDWFYEPKYNGWRTLVHLSSGTMFNREGLELSIADEFQPALEILRSLDAQAFKWADCEALERRHNVAGGTLIVLDLVPEPAFAGASYQERRKWIESVLVTAYPSNKPEPETVYKSPRICSLYAPQAWEQLQQINKRLGADFYEGLVAKRADAPYPIQLRSPKEESTAWMKHRWQF